MKKTTFLIIVIGAVVILAAGAIVLLKIGEKKEPIACTMEAKICSDGTAVGRIGLSCEFAPCPENRDTKTDLNSFFEIDKKENGTKIYYSEKLGVGFTYLNYTDRRPVVIKEDDNMISVDDQSIEVFTKDPGLSLEQAIEDKFLKGYNSAKCWVKIAETSEQKLANYIAASISYPKVEDDSAPFWENSKNCPQRYSETNGMQYFLMNKDVPDRFLFVRIGQYSAASDGTPKSETGGSNWAGSIRILPLKSKNSNVTGAIGLANPASANCVDKGGTLMMKENKLGQYGVCFFDDNRQCEEWALFRGECPVGGLKITGYENEAQAYCAITGGTVEGVGTESVLCKRVDGTRCEVTANFNGECPDPHDENPSAGNVEAL